MASISASQGRRPARPSTWSSYLTAMLPTSWFPSSSGPSRSSSPNTSPLSRIPRPIFYLATFLGTSYFLTTYLISKLAALHGRMTKEASSKETLKKRFQQNQNDVTFTVMALLPTLSAALSTGFDVEGVTASLRTAGASAAPKATASDAKPTSEAQQPTQEGQQSAAPSAVPPAVAEAAEPSIDPPAQPQSGLDAIAEPRPPPISPDATLPTPAPTTTEAAVEGSELAQAEAASSFNAETKDEKLQNGAQNAEDGSAVAEKAEDGQTTEAQAADHTAAQATNLPAMPVLDAEDSGRGGAHVNGDAVATEPGTEEQPGSDSTPNKAESAMEHKQEIPSQEPSETPAGEERPLEPASRQEEARVAQNGSGEQQPPEVNGDAQAQELSDETRTGTEQHEQEGQSKQLPEKATVQEAPSPEEEEQRRQQVLLERKRKAALWQELKIVAISKALTTVYAVNLLSLLTHVQLNLLGRYAYLGSLADENIEEDSADQALNSTRTTIDPFEDAWSRSLAASGGQAGEKGSGSTGNSERERLALSQETEERYLTFSWYFLHRGWKDLGQRVKEKVTECIESMPLKTQLTHSEMITILKRIRRRIEFEYENQDDGTGEQRSQERPEGQHHYHPQPPSDDPRDRMAFGAESLLPSGPSLRFGDADDMSASVMSTGSTTASTGTRRFRGLNAGRRKRFNLLQYLLPNTAEGDLALLHESGLLSQSSASHDASPPEILQSYDPRLTLLLDETRDLLFDSPDASRVLRRCLSASFDTTLFSNEGLRSAFGLPPVSSLPSPAAPLQQSRLQELQSKQEEADFLGAGRGGPAGSRLTLAALLPRLVRATDSALTSLPSECVDTVAGVEELRAFCAVVYSAWSGVG